MASWQIEQLVAEGRLHEILALLRQVCLLTPRSGLEPLRRELVQQAFRLAEVTRATRSGTIRSADLEYTYNRIAAALLEITDQMEQALGQDELGRHASAFLALSKDRSGDRPVDLVENGQACDVFVSHSHFDVERATQLARHLTACGLVVWIDQRIAGGQRFTDAIVAALDRARAVVVLWTDNAVKSDWVAYEARRAHQQGKHIPLIAAHLHIDDLPPPYPAVLHAIPMDDYAQLHVALKRLQVVVCSDDTAS